MMLTVLLTLALAAFPTRATEPRLANAVEIFTTNDYPADALRDQKQGVVTALVNVDAGGAPTACKVVKSSRVPSLDEVTCRLILARARFLPQRDAADQPIVGISQARIIWVLPPTNREPTTDAVVRAIFDLAADGSLSNCTATMNYTRSEPLVCSGATEFFATVPQARRTEWATVGTKLTFIAGHMVGSDESGSLLATLVGPGHATGYTASIGVDEDGTPRDCRLQLSDADPGGHEDALCATVLKKKFTALGRNELPRGVRHMVEVFGFAIHN